MKTRYKQIGKRSVSVLLSVLMILSTMMLGSIGTITASAEDTWRIRGTGFGTDISMSENWGDGYELDYDSSSGLYYKDLYMSNAQFKFTKGTGWTTQRGGYSNDTVGVGSGKISLNTAPNSTNFFYANANSTSSNNIKYRVVFDLTNSKVWVTSLSIGIVGAYIKKNESDANYVEWDTDRAISFDTHTSISDYSTNLYVNKDNVTPEFKLYNGHSSEWLGSSTALKRDGSTISFITKNSTNVSFDSAVTTGNYTIHYNPMNADVWLEAVVSTHDISIDSGVTNGSISVNNSLTEANYGDTVTFTATPTNTTDYYTSSVTVTKDGGGTVTAAPTGNTYEYSFTMPDDNVTISATFAQKQTYNITASVASASTGFGTVSPGSTTARTGDSVTITATPETDYNFSGWTITGDYTFASGSTLTSPSITIYPTSNVTLEANFVSASITRIYFHDKAEMGLPQIYYWNSSDSLNNNGWPGYSCIMTPVDGYINMYYADIDTSSINFDIDRLIINNMYIEPDRNSDMGAQTKDFVLASGKTIADYNGKVFTVSSTTPDNNDSYKYLSQVPTLVNTTYDFDTYVANSSNGVKLVGDSGYKRVYFYDKQKIFYNNRAYIQYGIGNKDYEPLTYKNVHARTTSTNSIDQYFPGKKMIPITDNPNYSSGNLYYADIPLFDIGENQTRRVSFNDGHKWTCDSGQHHITKSVEYPSEGKYIKLTDYNQGNGSGGFNGYFLLSSLDTGDNYSTITQEHSTVANGTINVWAKDGTVRDSAQDRNDGQYTEYIATTNFVCKDGTTISDYAHSHFNNHVAGGNVQKGKTITIKTTINGANKNKRYVKAFCINGYSYAIIDEPSATDTRRTTGVYTCEYTIPENLKETDLEITPIFFYLTDAKSDNKPNEYINFYAEDFVGGVQNAWGTTLSCYAWYDEKQDKNDGKRPAIGGYPGQPMVYLNGSHLMQIPRYTYYTDGTIHEIQGVTMNNYYWDDVHYYKGYLGTKGNNCQTYDYDDFVSLLKVNRLEDIIFSFKYRTANEGSGGNSIYTENKDKAYLYNTPGKVGNGWNALVDYYDYSVDVFGNRVPSSATTYYKEADIEAQITENIASYKANGSLTNNFVYIVSNGYETGEHDYIGYYATKWYIYNSNGEYLGALPPSAFEWNIPDEYLNSDLPVDPLEGYL